MAGRAWRPEDDGQTGRALVVLLRGARVALRLFRWTVQAAPVLGFAAGVCLAWRAGAEPNAALCVGVFGVILGAMIKDSFGRCFLTTS